MRTVLFRDDVVALELEGRENVMEVDVVFAKVEAVSSVAFRGGLATTIGQLKSIDVCPEQGECNETKCRAWEFDSVERTRRSHVARSLTLRERK